MGQAVVFYCVTSWSTCKKAQAWLDEKGIKYSYYDLLKQPPTAETLKEIAAAAGLTLKGIVNLRSQVFKKMDVDLEKLTDEEVVKLIQENSRIMLRPVLKKGKKAITGYKESTYEEFIL